MNLPLFTILGAVANAGMDAVDAVRRPKSALGSVSEQVPTGDSSTSSRPSSAMEHRIKTLEDNLARTLLVCEALWEMLEKSTGVTELQLLEKIEEIDMRDGTSDGKNQRKAIVCPECGRKSAPRHANCIYCGQPFIKSPFAM